jgi:hypothetical protein
MFKSKKVAPKGQPALKIAVVGTASTSSGEAPWGDESWQIWSLGANSALAPRFDKWFELHTRDVLSAAGAIDNRMEFLKKAGNKLMVGHDWPELPEAEMFPWVDVINEFGRYFTSSLAAMIALAIQQKPAEIGLWGIDMVCADEYAHQRSCCEYLLGIATGRGIKVTVAKESPILRPTRIYGLEDAGFSREIIERKAEIVKAVGELELQYNKLRDELTFCRGVLRTLTDLETRWA